MKRFKNQIAVITGANSGIGASISYFLACEGASVCLIGSNLENLKRTQEKICTETTSEVFIYQTDLAQEEEILMLVRSIEKDHGDVDILVHCAGVIALGSIEDAPAEDMDWQYKVNARAPYILTQGLLPSIKKREGQIVFINSTGILQAKANASQYTFSKTLMKVFADTLREEVNDDGVRVMSFFTGRTATPMQEKIYEQEGRDYDPDMLIQPDDIAHVLMSILSLPKTAEVTDISIRPMKKHTTS